MLERRGGGRRDEAARMRADAVLPPDILPEGRWSDGSGSPRLVLLTGACGFLGRQVARELLRQADLRLVCLVRHKADETATARVARIFTAMGIPQEEVERRVEVRVGDVAAPDLGLGADEYADLAGRLDAIYHCAALVDWVRGYGQLYPMNVGGVLSLIRLACRGKGKRLVFVSSLAVCYARGDPDRIDEDTDMLPHIEGMPLGYARSKCVAETLLRQAAERGVPVTILRPALIAGDSETGRSNPTDLIAALIQGCVATGMAIDTEWLLDCVPVDFVARVMAQVPQGEAGCRVLNLPHGRPRQWRELVLWMNLHGYPVRLVDADTWIRQVFEEGGGRGTMLYAQRQFFRGRPGRIGRPYEVYLAGGQQRIDSARTRALLDSLGLGEAALDADLLHGYFDDYRRADVLPPRPGVEKDGIAFEQLLAGPWRYMHLNGSAGRLRYAAHRRIGSDSGLLSEIAAARESASVGLWRLDLPSEPPLGGNGSPLVLKAKADDVLVQDLTVRMAALCRPTLGIQFDRFRDALGLAGSHERELALYEAEEPRLRRHMPACHGTLRGMDGRRWALLLEYLPEAESSANGYRLHAGEATMGDVISGLADIHATWFQREAELLAQPWLAAPPDTARMIDMTPLWRELADFASPWFSAWCGLEIRSVQQQLIDGLSEWWPRLSALPGALIHNDCNPRNLVLRHQGKGGDRLCVYDWELATLGIPQHDLAELLCFTWRSELPPERLDALLEMHRRALEQASGHAIDPETWRKGFTLALGHLLINRFAMYTLMHRFRPLAYLPRVLSNWVRLYAILNEWPAELPVATASPSATHASTA